MDIYIEEKPNVAKILAAQPSSGQSVKTNIGYISGQGWIIARSFGDSYEIYNAVWL